ncbi:MAG: A/G-specific adenine glycosylase [Blastocatellia bacterium]
MNLWSSSFTVRHVFGTSGNKPRDDDRAFGAAILAWFDERAARMPWRGSRDPYRIWLSEIMLQQTRIAVVEPYYQRFLERFPTIEALAAASPDEVLKCWEGLGYYSRARSLHRTAKLIVSERGGKFPPTAEGLEQLPGIGPYTAAAIASIAFGERIAAVDGNVIRVLTRLLDFEEEVGSQRVESELRVAAAARLPVERAGDYNQGLMDLGRTVCAPRHPNCSRCPIRRFCLAHQRGTVHLRPVKKRKGPLPIARAAAAVIRDAAGRVLLVQRPMDGLLGGLWALPGGNCIAEETYADCLRRNLRESLNIAIEIDREMAAATQDFTHFRLRLRAFACDLIGRGPQPRKKTRFVWVSPRKLGKYSLGKADREIIESLDQWQPRLFEEP